MGPLLFSMTTLPLIISAASQLKFAYLDDLTVGDDLTTLIRVVETIRETSATVGLNLNDSKSQIICSPSAKIPQELLSFKRINPEDASLLGVPLSVDSALSQVLQSRIEWFKVISSRLAFLHSQDALLILRHSFSTPKIQHVLRGIFCGDHHLLPELDLMLKTSLSQIINIQLNDDAWVQASLPINSGGLGIRSAVDLSASAFLASFQGSKEVISRILANVDAILPDPLEARALNFWSNQSGIIVSTMQHVSSKMKSWDEPVITAKFESLFSSASDDYNIATLRAVSAAHAGDWLKVIPSAALGLKLDNESFRIAVGFRLGSRICSSFLCACGAQMDPRGSHSLACRKSAGRQSRHATVNEVVYKAFVRAGIPAVKEPVGLIPASSLRPDGATIIPWKAGRCLAWDVTCPDTVASSYVTSCAATAGAAAEHAASLKSNKYQQLTTSHTFAPLVFETFGPLSADTLTILTSLGGKIISKTGDPRERTYLFQQLSMAVQRGNVACFLNCLPCD